MTVKEVLSLLSYGERFELVGARTGKRLCCSWNNKKEYIEKYNDYEDDDIEIDVKLTKRIKEACDIIGIKLLDHIIVGDNYYSFMEHNVL